jgi:uncharacterized protein YuzE
VKGHPDAEADALSIRLNERPIVATEVVRPGVLLDFDTSGHGVGIEMLNISTHMRPEEMRRLHVATT